MNPSERLLMTRRLWWLGRWRTLALMGAFLCGFIAMRLGAGVSDRAGVLGADAITHVYYTLGLFVLGGMDLGVPTGPTAPRIMLWVAYFLCPAITISAVVESVARALDPQGWALRRMKGHVVVGGGGRLARMFIHDLHQRAPETPVVIVESNHDVLTPEEASDQLGAQLVFGDVSSQQVLDTLRLEHARALVLMTGSDFTNMEAASKVAATVPQLAAQTTLHMSDITMLRLLESSGVLSQATIVNSHRIAAQHLVQTRLLTHFQRTEPRDAVVIAGFGRFGQTILRELQKHAPGAFETVIIIDTQAHRHVAVFAEQVGFDTHYERLIIQGDMADPTVWEQARQFIDQDMTEPVFVLGSSDDGNNLRVALWLTSKYPQAYTVALSFRQSTFARQVADSCNFDVVSAEDLITASLAGRHIDQAPHPPSPSTGDDIH